MPSEAKLELNTDEYITVPLEDVPLNVGLPYPLYISLSDRLVILRGRGDTLTADRVDRLQEKQLTCFYLRREDWQSYLTSLKQEIESVGLAGDADETNVLSLRNVIFAYTKAIEERQEFEKSLLVSLSGLTSKLSEAVGKSRTLAHKLIRRNDASLYFSNQSANIAIYSVAIGMKLRLSEEELAELALAACLANVGIVKVPREILYKPSPLTKEEMAVVRQHPVWGAEILKFLLAPKRVQLTALQHHERFDGQGYPNGLAGDDIEMFARIVSIAEVYNALISPRPWVAALPPAKAVEVLQQLPGKFDPEIFLLTLGG